MNKLKAIALCVVYLVMAVVSIPCIVLGFICALVIYGTLKIEQATIHVVDDADITRFWNKCADMLYDSFVSSGKAWRDGIEL